MFNNLVLVFVPSANCETNIDHAPRRSQREETYTAHMSWTPAVTHRQTPHTVGPVAQMAYEARMFAQVKTNVNMLSQS